MLEGYGKSSKAVGRVRSAPGPETHYAESPKLLAVFQRLRLGGGRQSPRPEGCARDRPGGPPKVRGEVIPPRNYSGSRHPAPNATRSTNLPSAARRRQPRTATDDNRQAVCAACHHVKTEADPQSPRGGQPQQAPAVNACTRSAPAPRRALSSKAGSSGPSCHSARPHSVGSGSTSSLRSIRSCSRFRQIRSPIVAQSTALVRVGAAVAVVVADLVGVDVVDTDRCGVRCTVRCGCEAERPALGRAQPCRRRG